MAAEVLFDASGEVMIQTEPRFGETGDPCCCPVGINNCAEFNAFYTSKNAVLNLTAANSNCNSCAAMSAAYVFAPSGPGERVITFTPTLDICPNLGTNRIVRLRLGIACNNAGFWGASLTAEVQTVFGIQNIDVFATVNTPLPWAGGGVTMAPANNNFFGDGSAARACVVAGSLSFV